MYYVMVRSFEVDTAGKWHGSMRGEELCLVGRSVARAVIRRYRRDYGTREKLWLSRSRRGKFSRE